jgi:hypothetical protein
VKLSDRQAAALSALAGMGCPVGGTALAQRMRANGRDTSTAAAHQAANGLVNKGLAVKGHPAGSPLSRYEITDEGRRVATGDAVDQAERERRQADRRMRLADAIGDRP